MSYVKLAVATAVIGLWSGVANADPLGGSGIASRSGSLAGVTFAPPYSSFAEPESFLLTVKMDLSRLADPQEWYDLYYSNLYYAARSPGEPVTWESRLTAEIAFDATKPQVLIWGRSPYTDVRITPTVDGFTFAYRNSGNPCVDKDFDFNCSQIDRIQGLTIIGTLIGDDPLTYSYTYGELPAAPEPATWAMMIAGFGLVGARLRARRPSAA